MFSKLQIYCENIMEAAWLAAAIAIPLFLNVSSTQTFEPDKVFVLRFLAIIAGAACLMKRVAGNGEHKDGIAGEAPFGSLLRHPPVLLVLALAAIYIVSSFFSIMPAVSWLGSYKRAQGTATFLCYVILFLVVLSELRNSAQLRRLQYAFMITSLPVAGYGILQHFGADFLPWSNPMQGRSSGSMGNPIFLGAYLAMVMPLTIGRLVVSVGTLRAGSNRKPASVLAGCCCLALGLQSLALFYTQSRGPVIGLVTSGYVCLFILLVLKRTSNKDRCLTPMIAAGVGILTPVLMVLIIHLTLSLGMRIAAMCLGIAVVCIAVVYWILWRRFWGRRWLWLTWLAQTAALILIFSIAPLRRISADMKFSPLGRLTEVSDNSVDVRRFVWQTGLSAVRSGSPSFMPDYSRAISRFLRPIIGYGPENIWFIANSYANPDLVRLHTSESVDRMHNETFDNLITVGFAGAALWLAVMATSFYYALRLLGFTGSGGWKTPFVFISVIGIIAGILWPWAAGYSYLIGVGAIAGLIAGVVAFAAWSGFRNLHTGFVGDSRQVWVFCILGALIAHFVEIGVGIAVTPTRTYFFILLALLSVFSVRNLHGVEAPIKRHASKPAIRTRSPLLILAMLSSSVVLVLCWCFIVNNSKESSAFALFLQTWFKGYPGISSSLPLPGSLVLLLLIIGGSIGFIYGETADKQDQATSFRKTAALSLALILSVWFLMAILSAVFWTTSDASSPVAVSLAAESRIALFIIALFLMILAAAKQLIGLDSARYAITIPVDARSAWAGVLIGICALGVIHEIALRPVRADIVCRIAGFYEKSADPADAVQLYQRASKLAPHVPSYWISMGLAQASAGAGDADRMQESFQSLQHAVDINPLDPESNTTLAAVYMQDAERSVEAAARRGQIDKAIQFYQRAAQLAPNYPEAYCGLGRCYFLLGEHDKAVGLFEKSLRLNPYYSRTYIFMGEMHYRLSDLGRAYQDFEAAVRLDRRNLDARKNLGFVLMRLGRKDEAMRVYLDALRHSPQDLVLLRRLSALCFSQRDAIGGHTYARRAYDATPATERGSYEQFAADLQNP